MTPDLRAVELLAAGASIGDCVAIASGDCVAIASGDCVAIASGDCVAVAVVPGGVGIAHGARCWSVPGDAAALLAPVEQAYAPRWVWWSARDAAGPLVAAGLRLSRCWDLAAVHRLIVGGSSGDPARVWAGAHGLDDARLPRLGQLDLLADADESTAPDPGSPDAAVRPDGYLRPEWLAAVDLPRSGRLAQLALAVHQRQLAALGPLADPRRVPTPPTLAVATARSESAAELLAVELSSHGLPLDRAVASAVLTSIVGPRSADDSALERARAERDASVLVHLRGHADGVAPIDLRSPGAVRQALADIGIDVPDTRSWRLEPFRGAHPLVDALLTWRRADRFATTYGYAWLDRHVGADGRLRGGWTGSDGAGGRMTAQSGLHNLPAELRPAVRAEPGHILVRADLGQVEPRVLAAVSGDDALVAATAADDLYLPVADRLRCDRPTAKVAVLAAMYGQTSGPAGQALRDLDRAYPVAMAYLRRADDDGRAGRDVRTYGGRRVRVGGVDEDDRRAVAGRGRFARNAVVQGAAAELFKAWAATVRLALDPGVGRIVLCLHDELLLHVRAEAGEATAAMLHATLDETAARWASGLGVRFVTDVAVVARWSDAKG